MLKTLIATGAVVLGAVLVHVAPADWIPSIVGAYVGMLFMWLVTLSDKLDTLERKLEGKRDIE